MKSNLWWNKNIRLADLTEASKFTTPLLMAFFPEVKTLTRLFGFPIKKG